MTQKLMYNNRELEIVDVWGKYSDDIQLELSWVDSDEEVPEEVYDHVYDAYGAIIYEMWFENKIALVDFMD